MSKKLCLLISIVLVLGLFSSASAAPKFDYRVCWWSDLGPGHDWNEPNNWYTMDRYWNDADNDDAIDTLERKFYVKVHPNQVPDVNTVVLVGKGISGVDYPEYLHFNPPPVDPTISSGTVVASYLSVSGGYSLDPNKTGGGAQGAVDHGDPNHWDPCMYHELTITDGTLNIGEPQTWEGYDTLYGYGYFSGMYSGSSLLLGTVGWYIPELGAGKGQGTMHMEGGTVNIGGNMGLGGWEQTIGTLNMTGGTINITQGLCCPLYPWGATGRLNLSGGTINAGYIFMNDSTGGDSGSIDVAGGKIILSRGNEVEELTDYSNGIGLYGAGTVSLTAYGVGHGEIITDDINFPDVNGQRAALSIDYDVSNEGKTTVQAFTTDPDQAWGPSPPNEAGSVKGTIANIARPVLSWSAGDNATSHEVYFSSDETLVSTRNASALKQTAYDPCEWTVDSDLVSLTTYYWAIDENPGPTLGQVWDFTMANLSKALLPSPADGATEVNPVVVLGWAAGIYASTHDVYFSSDFNDVNDRLISPVNTGATNSYDPPGNGLEFSTVYYWRVDECNAAGKPEWPGDVWSFTTHDRIIVETFDSYANDEAMKAVWKDYWYDTSSKNRAEVFVETTPDLVQDGQSMRYKYRNALKDAGKYAGSWSWAATTDLAAGTDWTASDVKVLTTYFLGDPCNGKDTTNLAQDQMYIELATGGASAVVEYPDMNAILEPFWHEWNIALQDFNDGGVTLSNVDTVYIGFGGYYKTGQTEIGAGYGDIVYFEDIELWPPKCLPSLTFSYADFTADCVIDLDDAEVMFNDWLVTDYNSLGFTGDLTGFPGPGEPNYDNCWVTGKVDSNTALYFNLGGTPQGDEYVKTPPLNLNTNAVTFTCWAKRHGLQRDDAGLFFCSWRDPPYGEGYGTTESGFVIGLGLDNSLNYNWQNAQPTYSWDPAIPVLPEDEWAFCALVVAPTWARIYIRRDTDLITDLFYEQNDVTHGPEAFGIPSRIGDHKTRRFVGAIDDFRIYDKSLNYDEVRYLATGGAYGTDPTGANLYAHYKFDDATGLMALDDAGDMVNWWPVPSTVNLVDPEPEGQRAVNFRDYRIMADNWLTERLWPLP